MIALIRHNISLGVTLAGILAGLCVLIYGAVSLVGGVIICISISNAPFDQGFRWSAALMVLGQHAITALAGLALLFFAIKGFVRRWRAGPPADEEAIGKSPIAKTVGLIVYGAGAIYGAYGLIFGMGPLLEDYQLAMSGDRVGARVISMEPAPDIHWDVQRVHYQFQTQDGQTIAGITNQFSYPAKQLLERGSVEVTYDPANPALNRIDFVFSLQSAIYFFGGQLIFLIVGIWGFAKNAEAMGEVPRPMTAQRMPLDPPRPTPSVIVDRNVARTTFGRRGS